MPKQRPNPLQQLVRKAIRDWADQINQHSEKPRKVKPKQSKSAPKSQLKQKRRSRYIPASIRVSVLHRDQYKCVFCGRSSQQVPLEVDHITPFSKGGSNDLNNLQTLCLDCNRGKGSRNLN
jgi:5-methylcytosine-specific restriction enzyme A